MKNFRLISTATAMAFAAFIGLTGVAGANPLYHNWMAPGLTQEQQAAMQQVYLDYEKQILPLQRQLEDKRVELDALYYGNSGDSGKAKTLLQEAADIEAKIFAANSEFRSKLEAKGVAGFDGYYGMNTYGYGGHRGWGGHHRGWGGHRWRGGHHW